MNLPNRFSTVEAFAAKYGLPDRLNDDARRAWKRRLAETLRARFPEDGGPGSTGWGTKQASHDRPESADCVCIKAPGWFEGADVLNGDSGQVQWGWNDLAGQVFIPVAAKDWLADEEQPTWPPENPPAVPVERPEIDIAALFTGLLARLDALIAGQTKLSADVAAAARAILDVTMTRGVKIRF